jgi:hypothetical protein
VAWRGGWELVLGDLREGYAGWPLGVRRNCELGYAGWLIGFLGMGEDAIRKVCCP